MTEPEWKNVTPKPAGYMRAHDAQQLSEGYSGWVWPNNGLHNADDVPVYLAPIVPTEQPGQPRCPYCNKTDLAWVPHELRRGRRDRMGYVEYHCYAAKCID